MPRLWYSVVINNPTAEDEACINEARENGYIIEGQLEKGKNGTPHYQLAVGTTDSWRDVKDAFPRANVQEARDPEALRQYCVKTETRLVDFTLPAAKPKQRCPPNKLTNVEFFDGLLSTMWDTACTSGNPSQARLLQSIESDTSMTLYDAAVKQWMGDASTPQFALDLGTRAIRPDVRAIYRRYRSAIATMWTPPEENIDLPMHIQDADEDEGSEQAAGVLGRKHEDDEGVSEGSEDEDGEDDSDSGEESEASDSESDSGNSGD